MAAHPNRDYFSVLLPLVSSKLGIVSALALHVGRETSLDSHPGILRTGPIRVDGEYENDDLVFMCINMEWYWKEHQSQIRSTWPPRSIHADDYLQLFHIFNNPRYHAHFDSGKWPTAFVHAFACPDCSVLTEDDHRQVCCRWLPIRDASFLA